jgi:hypothetical protein
MSLILISMIIALILAIFATLGVPRWEKLLGAAVIIVCIVLLLGRA